MHPVNFSLETCLDTLFLPGEQNHNSLFPTLVGFLSLSPPTFNRTSFCPRTRCFSEMFVVSSDVARQGRGRRWHGLWSCY